MISFLHLQACREIQGGLDSRGMLPARTVGRPLVEHSTRPAEPAGTKLGQARWVMH
jgi:hypothetical protein